MLKIIKSLVQYEHIALIFYNFYLKNILLYYSLKIGTGKIPIRIFKAILNYKTSLINVIIIIMIVAKFKIYVAKFSKECG